MELKLYFSKEEIISFLIKNGYTIKNTETWENGSKKSSSIEVAYPSAGDFDTNLFTGEKYSIRSKYGIEVVFKKIIKEKILNL